MCPVLSMLRILDRATIRPFLTHITLSILSEGSPRISCLRVSQQEWLAVPGAEEEDAAG